MALQITFSDAAMRKGHYPILVQPYECIMLRMHLNHILPTHS